MADDAQVRNPQTIPQCPPPPPSVERNFGLNITLNGY